MIGFESTVTRSQTICIDKKHWTETKELTLTTLTKSTTKFHISATTAWILSVFQYLTLVKNKKIIYHCLGCYSILLQCLPSMWFRAARCHVSSLRFMKYCLRSCAWWLHTSEGYPEEKLGFLKKRQTELRKVKEHLRVLELKLGNQNSITLFSVTFQITVISSSKNFHLLSDGVHKSVDLLHFRVGARRDAEERLHRAHDTQLRARPAVCGPPCQDFDTEGPAGVRPHGYSRF